MPTQPGPGETQPESQSRMETPLERVGPRVILPDVRAQIEAMAIENAPPPPPPAWRPLIGIVMSLLLGMFGAAIWAGITIFSGYQLGLVALVVGVLAGIGARVGGPGRPAQWTGAVCALVCYFAGQSGILAYEIGDYALEHPGEFSGRAATSQSAGPGQRAVGESEPAAAGASAPTSTSAADEREAGPQATSMSEVVKAFAMLAAVIVMSAVTWTFQGMGILFLAIAVYEGYRIPRAG